MNILLACEESQAVCKEMRRLNQNAFSCDILPCSGGHPEWHIQTDALHVLNGFVFFATQDRKIHTVENWDLIIAFPPCTYLTVTGNRWYDVEKYGAKAVERFNNREKAIDFFMRFANAPCGHIAIENPIGVMSTRYRKPNQIIHPYYFGDAERKSTCLWLKNLPCLEPTNIVEPVLYKYKNGTGTDSAWHMRTISLPPDERARERSKTYPGVAKAMASQWIKYLQEENK